MIYHSRAKYHRNRDAIDCANLVNCCDNVISNIFADLFLEDAYFKGKTSFNRFHFSFNRFHIYIYHRVVSKFLMNLLEKVLFIG